MSTHQEALARLRRKANAPVTLPSSPRQRLEQRARPIVSRPPPSSLIDHLYDELRVLAAAPPTAEGEARYRSLLKKLRSLEAEDARQLRQQLATRIASPEILAGLTRTREGGTGCRC